MVRQTLVRRAVRIRWPVRRKHHLRRTCVRHNRRTRRVRLTRCSASRPHPHHLRHRKHARNTRPLPSNLIGRANSRSVSRRRMGNCGADSRPSSRPSSRSGSGPVRSTPAHRRRGRRRRAHSRRGRRRARNSQGDNRRVVSMRLPRRDRSTALSSAHRSQANPRPGRPRPGRLRAGRCGVCSRSNLANSLVSDRQAGNRSPWPRSQAHLSRGNRFSPVSTEGRR